MAGMFNGLKHMLTFDSARLARSGEKRSTLKMAYIELELKMLKSTLPIMKRPSLSIYLLVALVAALSVVGCKNWSESGTGTLRIVINKNGQTLGYDTSSGVEILTVKGLAFKDLNKNGKLDTYEDWRVAVEERAKDLASKLSMDEIAGIMLYSAHQAIPSGSTRFGASTYNGKPFAESGAKPFDLCDRKSNS
jgi:beta-glucosidase